MAYSQEQLEQAFGRFGAVGRVHVQRSDRRNSRSDKRHGSKFAFVYFVEEGSAERAVEVAQGPGVSASVGLGWLACFERVRFKLGRWFLGDVSGMLRANPRVF